MRVAIITGAARGIGYATASQLARDGFSLAILDYQEEASVTKAVEALSELGQPVTYYRGDLSVRSDREGFVDHVMKEYGRIDALVNNAGVAPRVRLDLLDTTEESFDFVVGVNLKGTFFLTQRVAREMMRQTESEPEATPTIVNIASVSSYTSSTSRGEYCISKAGVSMVTKLFADRLADSGINVYEVRPGVIATDMTGNVKEEYDTLIQNGLMPIRRWGKPEDVADAVSVLCSGRLRYSTGDAINVDGGFHLRRL